MPLPMMPRRGFAILMGWPRLQNSDDDETFDDEVEDREQLCSYLEDLVAP